MTDAVLIYRPELAAYDLGDGHPFNPVRLELTVELMEACGLLGEGALILPRAATERELLLVHSGRYIEAVHEASDWASGFRPSMGLGTEDNPIFPGLHDVAALTCGAAITAVDEVLSSRRRRAFSVAGGLHHAHRDRAAGFSVYNDAAVAIAVAREADPTLRVLYLDIDAHHGDGVHEAFAGSPDVLTISLHESGVFAFPGTGFPSEKGYDAGEGFSANVPMPQLATDECYRMVFDGVVVPLARAFAPDLIVAQLGADAHHADPMTELGMTLPGYRVMVRRVLSLADELCGGRLVALGGGGYHLVEVVPLAWTQAFAEMLGVELADEVPESWRDGVRARMGCEPPSSMGAADRFELEPERDAQVIAEAARVIREVRAAVFPRHGLAP